MTVPGMPKIIWAYFDHHTAQRNAVGFLVLGVLVSAAMWGLPRYWRATALAVCLMAPVAKDSAQIGMATRHFNTGATCLGIVGALAGFGVAHLMLRLWTAGRSSLAE